MLRLVLLYIAMHCSLCCAAQTKHVIWDAINNFPIPHASVHTRHNGRIRAALSDSTGTVYITFPHQKLTITHISYYSQTFTTLPDTIFLQPKTEMLTEIIIKDSEPQWIREKLRTFLQTKEKRYQTRALHLAYQYHKRNIGDSIGYAFSSTGVLYVPSLHQLSKDSMYTITPHTNVVHYQDTTAGVDFHDMQRMLYENIVAMIDRKFIKHHYFRINKAYHNHNKNMVQIVFWSAKNRDDRGTILMDTTECTILEASRTTGLKTNLQEKIPPLVYSIFRGAIGLEHEVWSIDQKINFVQIEGSLYPSEITYKEDERRSNYNKIAIMSNKTRISYFKMREAHLSLTTPPPSLSGHPSYNLPHEIRAAIIYIESKRHARNRIAMQGMRRSYTLFE